MQWWVEEQGERAHSKVKAQAEAVSPWMWPLMAETKATVRGNRCGMGEGYRKLTAGWLLLLSPQKTFGRNRMEAAEEQVRCLKPGLAVLQWHYLGVGEWDHDLNL